MESLPYEQKVEILRRLPRDGLLAVAQTSTAMLDAASDERLWREGGFAAVTRASDKGWASVGKSTDRRDARKSTNATDAESTLAPIGCLHPSSRSIVECVALNGVAAWIARVLRFPSYAITPMITHERNSPFHLRVSLHPMKQSLAAAETLSFRSFGKHKNQDPTTTEVSPLLNSADRAVAAAGEFAAVAERLAEVLRDDAESTRRRLKTSKTLSQTLPRDERESSATKSDRVVDAAAAAAESVRAERGSLRVRLTASFLVGVHGNEAVWTSRLSRDEEEGARRKRNVVVLSRSPPPWSRGLRADAEAPTTKEENRDAHRDDASYTRQSPEITPARVITRVPCPATPWSLLRARLVGEALAALAASAPEEERKGKTLLAWGRATRAVSAAARDEETSSGDPNDADDASDAVPLHDGIMMTSDAPSSPTNDQSVADARAGVAWPALVRDPREAATRATEFAARAAAERGGQTERPRGFVVGGCACRDRVAAVVHGALAASDPTSFLDELALDDGDARADAGDGDRVGNEASAARRLSADHRAGATALAVLACAPRAHECTLGAGRFARLLGRAAWTLRLRDALHDRSDALREARWDAVLATEKPAESFSSSRAEKDAFFSCPGATESDACLAMWLERCAVALEDAREKWEPREAAEAATELAAAAAAVARATLVADAGGPGDAPGAGAGAGAGSSHDARGDSEQLRAARRVMLRRARETLDQCLVAVGVLERRGW